MVVYMYLIREGKIQMKILENKERLKNIAVIVLVILMCGIIFFYETKKVGFHEDEGYSIASAVNPTNGLMEAYEPGVDGPVWKTRDFVRDYVTLAPENIFNFWALYHNQAGDNHPPLFYTLVHFSTLLFGGQFTKYSVFVVNIIAFALSCFVIRRILKVLNKDNLTIPILIFYGLSMGTMSMVIFQRMYMLLTFFIILYFYYSIRIYLNKFELSKELLIKLGFTTVLGFLTQYYFAIYAFLIFAIMAIGMIRKKMYKNAAKYLGFHVLYAVIGVLLFVPCIYHLFFTDRGLKNLANSAYFEHLIDYVKHFAYAFSINDNMILICSVLLVFLAGLIYWFKKSDKKLVVLLTTVPSIIYFFLVVKLTSFQELRYIMPVIPFVSLSVFFILDKLLQFKHKNIVITVIAVVLVVNGIIFSKPKFLYEEYAQCLEIAEENKDKSFVYIYDNFFNHMQSIPEMMIYEKTLIVNINNNDMQYLLNNNELNTEDSYILCIKSYMDNDAILNEITSNTDFKNVTKLFEGDNSSEKISNNLYLVSK